MFLRPLKFAVNHVYGLTVAGLFAVAAQGAVSSALRQNAPSPQTNDIKAGVLVVFTSRSGVQTVLTNGPLAAGDGISEYANIKDDYKSFDDLEKAAFAIIDEKESTNLRAVQIRQSDIIDGELISAYRFGSVPQVCESENRCRPIASADLGTSSLAYDAKREISRTIDQYKELQAEYDKPASTAGHIWRKTQKEFYAIPVVQDVTNFIHNFRIG